MNHSSPVPEFIDPVFRKTSLKSSFSVIQNERFGLVFSKTGSIISGTGDCFALYILFQSFIKSALCTVSYLVQFSKKILGYCL
jgi:hypothetical protein